MDVKNIIEYAAIVAGLICLLVFARGAMAALSKAKTSPVMTRGLPIEKAGIDDITKLVDALGRLADAFTKAGPTISALIGALGFFILAAVMAG